MKPMNYLSKGKLEDLENIGGIAEMVWDLFSQCALTGDV